MANILIVDDDPFIRETLVLNMSDLNHSSMVAETLAEGLSLSRIAPFDVIFLDIDLPDGSGLSGLPHFHESDSKPEVIIITGSGSAQSAEMAIANGAWDYIQKPFNKQDIRLQLTRALEYRSSKLKRKKQPFLTLKRADIIGNSPALNRCLDKAAQSVTNEANVLITGETGSGKEGFAKMIHLNSQVAQKKFIVVDCAAFPEQLVESILFGHVRGSFTGAERDHEGLIKQADGGTLFLDEIGELALSIQKKLLRVLQERCFKPVGSTSEVESNFRLIAATNRDLEDMVSKGEFREDLLHRLRTFHINLPPLRNCQGDIRSLTLHYIDKICKEQNIETKGFSPEFISCLEAYDWPGNVRELIHTLEEAVFTDLESPKLFPVHLPRRVRMSYLQHDKEGANASMPQKISVDKIAETEEISVHFKFSDTIPPLRKFRDNVNSQIEKAYLLKILNFTNNDLERVSSYSELSKPRLYALLKKYNIKRN